MPSWTDWIFGNIIGGRGGPLLVLYTHTILVRTRVILTAASSQGGPAGGGGLLVGTVAAGL